VIKSTKSGKLIGIANQKMIALLADNIRSEDPSSMLKMVGVLLVHRWLSSKCSYWIEAFLQRGEMYLP
jgi:hypothetical protein